MTFWVLKKLPILIPLLLLLTLCILGTVFVLAGNLSTGFGVTDNNQGPPPPANPNVPSTTVTPPLQTSPYCARLGDAGPGNPFSGFPTTDPTLQSAAYIGTDFCDPNYGQTWQHEGIDFLYWTGVPIASTGDGIVIHAGYDNNIGNLVVICSGADWCARFGHLSTITVSQGDTVTHGQLIGEAGNTGQYTTGPHLHYDIYNVDGFWDPFPTLYN